MSSNRIDEFILYNGYMHICNLIYWLVTKYGFKISWIAKNAGGPQLKNDVVYENMKTIGFTNAVTFIKQVCSVFGIRTTDVPYQQQCLKLE